MTAADITPDEVTVSPAGVVREVFLTAGARRAADEYERMPHPEDYVLGLMVANSTLLVQSIVAVDAARRDTSESAPVLRELAYGNMTALADEVLDSINGWHAAARRLARKRQAENALSTVQWPASVPAGGDAA